ncbi:MAG: dipeptide ABC transporter ATP-binding protein [Candidatus Berkiellales bacterium]
MTEVILNIKQLTVQIHTPNGVIRPVDGVDLTLHRGEVFALVGESGCGKTMTALAINRLLPMHAALCQGSEVYLQDTPLHQLSEQAMQRIRGQKIAMIFQDPALALNPVFTIGEQIIEAYLQGNGRIKSHREVKKAVIELLEQVSIPDPELFLEQYPHQLSGGMKQRIVIAMALAKSPDVLIADEPTTALDVTTQAQVLALIKDLQKQYNMAILMITHDLGIVAHMADTVAVMYAGHLIEQANKQNFFINQNHPYSKRLFAALPELTEQGRSLAIIPGQVPTLDKEFPLCRFKERCPYVFSSCEEIKPKWLTINDQQKVRCHWYDQEILKKIPTQLRIESLIMHGSSPVKIETQLEPEDQRTLLTVEGLKVYFPIRRGIFKRKVGEVKAVDDLALKLLEGQTLALVGESGCGKTTVGKAILRLVEETAGEVTFLDQDLFRLSRRKLRKFRSHFQMIFQDPYSSMDPRMTVNKIIEEGMLAMKIGSNRQERSDRINVLLQQVGLPQYMKNRYPHQLSGGQRQRVAIARALAVGAQLIICDEPTSALDLSVQAQILNLLKSLQQDLGISYLFITHNIGVVNYLADYVAVMYLGRIVEYGPAQEVLASPKHPYTQALLDAVPKANLETKQLKAPKGEVPSASHPPVGCHFSPRCPFAHERCFGKYPENYQVDTQRAVKCYLYSPEEIDKEKKVGNDGVLKITS